MKKKTQAQERKIKYCQPHSYQHCEKSSRSITSVIDGDLLYINKGVRTDCNSYRGMFLLNIMGIIFAPSILQQLAERVYSDSLCGFRSGWSTVDRVFSDRQMQKKCRVQNMPLYISFIDLTKALDLVSRNCLFKILTKIGCPPNL